MESPSVKLTIAIFAILVLSTTVLGAVGLSLSFVVRAQFRKKKLSSNAAFCLTQRQENRKPPIFVQQKPETSEFRYWKPLRRRLSAFSAVNPFGDSESAVSHTIENSPGPSSLTLTYPSGTPRLDLVAVSSTPLFKKYVYDESELDLIKKVVEEDAAFSPFQKHGSGEKRSKVRLSQLLRVSYPIPRSQCLDLNVMAADVEEIAAGVASDEPLLRSMSLLRFVAIGTTEETYDNPYYFTRPFQEIIAVCSEPSTLSDESESLQKCVADVVVCWSWNQWCCANRAKTNGGELIRVLAQAASMAEDGTYYSASHEEVMAVLCQMYSGFGSFAANFSRPVMLKLATVMKACSATAPCHSHRDLVPIFAQAVSIAQKPNTLVALYECLSVLVSPHRECCLEYRDLAPPTSDLLALLRHGLWTRQPPEIREKAKALADKLSEQFSQMEEWCDQGDTTTETMEVKAPGAWSMFR